MLLCKYLSIVRAIVTVLLYLPHPFVFMYVVIWEGFFFMGGGGGGGTTPYFSFLYIRSDICSIKILYEGHKLIAFHMSLQCLNTLIYNVSK